MRKSGIVLLVTASVLASAALAQGKAAAPSASTLYLAGTCTSCHGTEGKNIGQIPPLAGKERQYLRDQLRLFKTDVLKVTLMNQLSKGYTEEELNALADYYSTKK